MTCKVAVNAYCVAFYAETSETLTPCTDPNWMLLLIDADNDSSTGWYGYDFIVNLKVNGPRSTTLMRYDAASGEWTDAVEVPMRYAGNRLELSLPREVLGLTGESFTFDFKWADNPAELKDPISFCLDGDTAPTRRFNYRCIWSAAQGQE